MSEIDSNIPLESFVEEQEIRGMVYHSPSGPVEGYQWRLRVTQTATGRDEWLPWVFGSCVSVDQMLEQWRKFLATQGRVAKPEPGQLNVRRVERYEAQNRDLSTGGPEPMKVIDLIVVSSGKSRDIDTSPNYRMTLAQARELQQYLATAIAVAESQAAGPMH